jgi:hypothetical protein
MLFGSLPSSRPRVFHVVGVVNVLTPLLQRATSGVSTPFSIAGAPIARDALALEFGVDQRLTSNVKLGVYSSGLLVVERQRKRHQGQARGDFLKGRPGAVG